MKLVARKMVEDAGVDVDRLVKLLVKNAAAELTTYYYYTILRVNLIGIEVKRYITRTEQAESLHLLALAQKLREILAVEQEHAMDLSQALGR